MDSLAALLRDRVRTLGWSYAEAARRCGLPRSTVHHLATTERFRRMPQPQTLQALARGLDLPLDSVRQAAATSAGIEVHRAQAQDPDVAVLIASLGALSQQDRRHVMALVDSLSRQARPAEPDTERRAQP